MFIKTPSAWKGTEVSSLPSTSLPEACGYKHHVPARKHVTGKWFSTRITWTKRGATGRGCTRRGSTLMQEISYSETISHWTTSPGMLWCVHQWRFSRCNQTACQVVSSRLPFSQRDGLDDLLSSFPNFIVLWCQKKGSVHCINTQSHIPPPKHNSWWDRNTHHKEAGEKSQD